jgi:hypothetical protein
MNEEAITRAFEAGAPISCATCKFFHEGNMSCGKTECGGPGVGRDYPSYNGPIPRERFSERCLVCGAANVAFHIVLGAGKTKFGLCQKHRKVFDHVGAAEGMIKHPVTLIAVR